ncbi:isoform a [Stylonychia lemnae]|uniref:Isoform a n=1 Tax=Stylonychia lemnae TaxID=5949 RepID=A0A077ZUU5_STYLE|nr:isoform a [Stylonychia lemnae]|eukprot:CDW73680.1 isoform a [Stylonychia lemnae]
MLEQYNDQLLLSQDSKRDPINMTLTSIDENSPEISNHYSEARMSTESNYSNQRDSLPMTSFNKTQSLDRMGLNIISTLNQLAQFSNHKSQPREEKIKYCQRCAEKKGQVNCVDCGNITLCVQCSDIIHSLGIFVSHRLKKLSQPLAQSEVGDYEFIPCQKHQDQNLVSFCTYDWTPLCKHCMSEHQDHQQVKYSKALEQLRSELKQKQKRLKIILHNLKLTQKNNVEMKQYNSQDYDKQVAQVKQSFDQLRNYLNKKESEIIEVFDQNQQKFSDIINDMEQQLKDKYEKAQSALYFTDQALLNAHFTLHQGINYLSEKLQNTFLSCCDLKSLEQEKPIYNFDQQDLIVDFQKILDSCFNQRDSIQLLQSIQINNNINDTIRESQESMKFQETNRLSTDNENQPTQSRDKSIPYKQIYQTNQIGKTITNQNYYAKHRKGNSHSTLTDFLALKQHSQVLKERKKNKIHVKLERNQDSLILDEKTTDKVPTNLTQNEAELRFTFGQKKENQVLMVSQIHNLSQKQIVNLAQIENQRLSEGESLKRKLSSAAVQQFNRQSKDLKDQMDQLLVNKSKQRKSSKPITNNENQVKPPNIMTKTPVQFQSQVIQETKERESPNSNVSRRNQADKQKTPNQYNASLEFNSKKTVITPKNQAGVPKKEFSLPQSKSGLKMCKPLGQQSLLHDISLSRMPTMREDSIEFQGEQTFSLRRNSRNQINSQPINKQSTQQKLSSLINNQSLQQSSSNSNLKALMRPNDLTKKEIKDMTQEPLMKRRFLVRASYSSSVQVSWSHPKGSNIEGLRYILEYGVGIKVNGHEQFRQIYKGKAFKCIVTDLIPKTNYRFRVAAVIIKDNKEEVGEWSDVESVQTSDIQQIDFNSLYNVAVYTPIVKSQSSNVVNQSIVMNQGNQTATLQQLQNNPIGGERWIQFERPGLIHSLNSLCFGKHYWSVSVLYTQNLNLNNEEFSGLLKLGLFSKNSAAQKIYGPVINYSTSKGLIKVKFFLDYEQKQLKVYTHSNPKGEIYPDIPELGLFPSAQNMTMRSKNATLRVSFAFDLPAFEFNNETGCIKDL